MSVSSSTAKAGPYQGNGATTAFSFAVQMTSAADVRVIKTQFVAGLYHDIDLTQGADYTVSLNADQTAAPGGTITCTTAPIATESISILRAIAATQAAVIPNQGGFYPKVIEGALDKLTLMVQQLSADVDRSFRTSYGDTNTTQISDLVSAVTLGSDIAMSNAAAAVVSANASAASAAVAASWATGCFRNRVINGNFNIWQRGASVAPGALGSLTSYVADRWVSYQTGAALAVSRVGGTGPFPYCAAWNGGVGNTEVTMFQCVEAANAASMYGASAITLSMWLFSNIAKTFSLFIDTANVADVFSGTTSRSTVGFAHPGTGWVYTSLTYSSPHADIRNGIRIRVTTTNCTSGTFALTGVQLEPGTVATPFEHRPYGMELALCQRYYYRITGQRFGTAIGAATNATAHVLTKFPVTMRATPSLEQTGTASDYGVTRCGSATATVCTSAPALITVSTEYAETAFTVTSGVVIGSAGAGYAAVGTAYLGWSAEL